MVANDIKVEWSKYESSPERYGQIIVEFSDLTIFNPNIPHTTPYPTPLPL